MYNYWTDKIDFKAKIAKELYPLLKSFIGKRITDKTLDEVKTKTTEWMANLDDVVFDCEIKIDVTKKVTKDPISGMDHYYDAVEAILVAPVDM